MNEPIFPLSEFPQASWRKACHANNTCLHAAVYRDQRKQVVLVKDAQNEILTLTPATWQQLIAGVKAG